MELLCQSLGMSYQIDGSNAAFSESSQTQHSAQMISVFIPPADVLEASNEDEAYQKFIEALRTLRIILEIPDGRINMPD